MKVVDRKTFLTLPPGTVFAKFGDPVIENCVGLGPLSIKGANRGEVDWYYTDLAVWPENVDTNELLEIYDRLKAGENLPADFDASVDDGLFEDGQLFAVYDRNDVSELINRLLTARAMVFG